MVLLLLLGSATVMAQEDKSVNLSVEARGDYQRTSVDGETLKDECGFKGNLVNLKLDGNISRDFSYGYRQRLNGINKDKTFFDATDWLYLNYQATENLALSAGKNVVLVGGWEFEAAPIDCYFLSEFCYNFACYQWGGSVIVNTTDKKDDLTFQLCQSPFQKHYTATTGKSADMYSFSLMWHGRHGFFEPLWSVNMMEYEPGKYINYIALGSKFHVGNRMQIDFDYMNRAVSGHAFWGRDCTVIGRVSVQPSDKLNLFVKASYDVNQTDKTADACVLNGTEVTRVGAGFEYFPLGNNKVRLHGNYCYSFGKNTNPGGTLQDKLSIFDFGVSWRVKLL